METSIGQGRVTRTGSLVTLVSYGRMLPLCNKVAEALASEALAPTSHLDNMVTKTGEKYGLKGDEKKAYPVEVIDLRSIYPYDWTMVKESVRKTGRVLFVNEDTEVTNFAEHLSYRVNP